MVLAALVYIFKPIVVVWGVMNAIDDLTMVFRVGRLAAVLIPGGDKRTCAMCATM